MKNLYFFFILPKKCYALFVSFRLINSSVKFGISISKNQSSKNKNKTKTAPEIVALLFFTCFLLFPNIPGLGWLSGQGH